jgi:PAS domain S-box-containing protein
VPRAAAARIHALDRHSVDIAARLAENVIANLRLRESESRFRAMADSSPFLIWTSDAEARLEWANRSLLAFTGRTLEEERTVDRWGDVHPDDGAAVRAPYERALAARAPFQFEFRRRRWDGAWRWMRDTGVPRFRDDGGFAGFVGSAADVTGEREARERADAMATRFHTVLETATDAILVLDERLDVVFFNRAAEELSGWLRSEVLHRPVERLVPEEQRAAYRAGMERFLAEGRERALHVTTGHVVGRRRDGARFTAEVSLSLGREGERLMVTMILRDVSARLAAEEALREAEERLQVAEKLTSIADMASATVHDLNSMLMSVQCAADLLAARTGDAHLAEVDMIRAAVEKGTQLTRRLSHVSRQRYQDAQLVEVPVVVGELLPVLRRILGKRHVVEAATAGEVPPTQVVRTDLEQALLNLVTNARDAMPEGGPVRLEVAGRELEGAEAAAAGVRPGTYAAIAVTDAGTGMDEATLARVFEPFFTTKGPARGTGLGLYTVRRFLARSGGGITVRTAPGEGTTFTLLLPAPGTPRRGAGPAGAA